MIKLKDLIKENVQLPNGVQIQMGKIFTGEGRAFVKEEDIESVNEVDFLDRKRDKAKKHFLKALQNTEKHIKRIKQFAKGNEWGMVSSFIEDGLVYDMRDLDREITTIISIPPIGKESVKEAGMGILTSDQADILQGIVLRNKNKNLKGILNVALKSGHFKGVDKKELLGYIDGAKQFVKYMKSHPMESIKEEKEQLNEWGDLYSHIKSVESHLAEFKKNIDSKRGGSLDSDSVEYESDRWHNNSKMLKGRDKKLGMWEKKVKKTLDSLIKDYVNAWK